jgi:hypothetical protein
MFKNALFLAYLKTPTSKWKCISQIGSSVHAVYSFNMPSVVQRNTIDDSSNYKATRNANREDSLKTVLFAHWLHTLTYFIQINY